MDQKGFVYLSGTFSGWESSFSSILLASNGFKYTGIGDVVKCVECGIELGGWREGENVKEKHYKASPNCKSVQQYASKFSVLQNETSVGNSLQNMAISAGSNSNYTDHGRLNDITNGVQANVNDNIGTDTRQKVLTSKFLPTQSENRLPVPVKIIKEDLRTAGPVTYHARNPQHNPGIPPAEQADTEDPVEETIQFQRTLPKAKEQMYETESSRLASYNHWPIDSPVRPEDLAKAGLYYTGAGDKVKCAFCLGAMYNWERDDIPISEHSKHYPECKFVKFSMYANLFPQRSNLTTTRSANSPAPENQSSEQQSTTVVTSQNAVAAGGVNTDFEQITAVKVVHEMGYNYAMIRDAVKKIPNYNPQTLNTGTLLDVIFEMESNGYAEKPMVSESASHELRCEGGTSEEDSLYAAASVASRSSPPGMTTHQNGGSQSTNIFFSAQTANVFLTSDQQGSVSTMPRLATSDRYLGTLEEPSAPVPEPKCINQKLENISRPSVQSGNKGTSSSLTSLSRKQPLEVNQGYKKLSDEHAKLSKNKICNVCNKDVVSILFLPCRHLIACESCSAAMKNCSQCDKLIIGTVKIYLS